MIFHSYVSLPEGNYGSIPFPANLLYLLYAIPCYGNYE